MPTPTRQAAVLVSLVALCLAVGAIAGFATASSVTTWYAALAKPSFNPPNWLFGPVWTALYILMAISAWLVWRKAGWRPLRLFFLQLALNFAWSFLFFGFHQIGVALVDIVALFLLIAATALAFGKHSLFGAILLLPYLAWVGFATALNLAIWRLI